MQFLITIDTEEDNQWARPFPLTTENAQYIPRFQQLCDRYAFKPTYLCTYGMIRDKRFCDLMRPYWSSGCAEIGAHLHPWSTPPYEAEEGDRTKCQPFPSELSLPLFERKMRTLTEAIAEATGAPPRSYRAGRYGFHGSHLEALERLGYDIDCSVVPYTSYAGMPGLIGGAGGPDFRRARPGAYRPSHTDVTQAGESNILEVPVTVTFTKWPLDRSPRLQKAWIANEAAWPVRLMRRLGYGPHWLRPRRGTAAKDMLAVHRAAVRQGLPFSEMILHSSELMPACSPTFPDSESIDELYRTLEAAFAGIAASGASGCTLSEFYDSRASSCRTWNPALTSEGRRQPFHV